MVIVVPCRCLGSGLDFWLLGHEVGSDIVEILHLLALVVLEEALIGTEVCLVVGVETLGNAVEHHGRNNVQDLVDVGLLQSLSVITASLGDCQETHKQSCDSG